MMYPVPFRAEHLLRMELQPAQRPSAERMTAAGVRTLEGAHSHTLMLDGEPIVCTGVVEFHENLGRVWAILSARVTPALFREIHCWARIYLNGLPYRRVEATVDECFAPGHRWARSLGFTVEGYMRAFGADGSDHMLYARVMPCPA